jgi:hypothetical protein
MIIDVNAAVGRWPFCEGQSMTPSRLSRLLAEAGVDVAMTSSLEAIFHEDADEDNRRLLRQLRGHPRLRPVPVINPSVANWPESLERWGPEALAVKILPSYHAYTLADPRVYALAAELTRRRQPLLVQVRMEDERVQAPAFRVPPVPVADIAALAGRFPRLTIVALGTYLPEATSLLRGSPGVRPRQSNQSSFIAPRREPPSAAFRSVGTPGALQVSQVKPARAATSKSGSCGTGFDQRCGSSRSAAAMCAGSPNSERPTENAFRSPPITTGASRS